MYYIKCRKKDNKSSNKIYFQNINLPCCRKTSSWSSMPSRSSSNGLSFFTNAYTYFANAAGSASQLKKVYNSYLFTTYEQPLDYLIIVTNKCVALYLYKHLYSLVYFYSLCTLFTLWLPNKVQCVYFFFKFMYIWPSVHTISTMLAQYFNNSCKLSEIRNDSFLDKALFINKSNNNYFKNIQKTT